MYALLCVYISSTSLENIKVKIVAFIYIGTAIYSKKKKQYILPHIVIYTNAKLYALIFP